MITDEELVSLVDEEFDTALGAPGGEISGERAEAYDYYLRKLFGNEEEGQSKVVTSDVADIVDGIMPSLLRIFTTADNLVNFDAVGPEDEARAEQESDYINYTFHKRNPAFEIMFFWFFDALVQKNGIVKAWWDDSEEVTTESYEGLSEDDLAQLLEDDELEPVEQEERTEEDMGVEYTVYDVKFRRVSKSGRASVDNVPPEEYRISNDARGLNPSKARMVGHEREVTRSELLEMGFKKSLVDKLPAEGNDAETQEEIARRDKTDDQRELKSRDRSQDIITLREAYIRVDKDGDGRAELHQAFTAGGKLLSDEPADRQPFHVICPHPLPHKHFGLATSEKVMDVQLVASTILRQTLDNLYHTNNPGHGVWEDAMTSNTMDDLLTSRVGRVARFARPVNESYAPITVPFTAAQSFPMLDYWDKVKRDRTGVSADSEGLDPDSLKNIQTSVLAQAVDISKQKIETIARIFAETGIKSLFLHLHELLLKHQKKEEIVKLRGDWVPVNPQEWRTRRDMTVNIGLGIGTREQNLLHLQAIWDKQKDALESGGQNLLVTPRHFFNTAAEFVKNANLKTSEMFFSDPGDSEFGNDPQLQQAQQIIQQLQAQLQSREHELRAQEQAIDRERNQMQHRKDMEEVMIKREKVDNDLFARMEEISTKLTELELENNRDIPGSKV